MSAPQLVIIGLDCAEPTLIARWRADLPTLDRLMRQGSSGRMESCIPAITVPAWSCMLSGRDPGELGIYGFRNRADRSYGKMTTADGRAVRLPRLWDLLGDAGWRCAVVGVPGTWPPPPINGSLVSCFLAPSTDVPYTHPAELASSIESLLGSEPYLLDIPDFRSTDRDRILRDIITLCEQRFAVAELLLERDAPDLLLLVDMGTDRIHHAFWKFIDPTHPLHEPDSPYANVIHDYYVRLDGLIARLLAKVGDATPLLVVSDHGARPLMGGVCVNEWLRQHGWLTLASEPAGPIAIDAAAVNWGATKAWGAGGYYGRIFMNVRGREAEGVIAAADYARERAALADALRAMPGPDGQLLGNRVFVPQEIYRSVRGVAPDLIVYFGDLAWRAVGLVGGTLFTIENDTGPDDANHAQFGTLIWHDPAQPGGGRDLGDVSIYAILPTLLDRFGVPAPTGLRGVAQRW